MPRCQHCGGPVLFETLPSPAPVRYFQDADLPGSGACLHCSRPYLRLPDGAVVALEAA